MHRLKIPLTALLLMFALVDSIVGYRLFNSGWPKSIALTSAPMGTEQVHVLPIPFTNLDWAVLVLVFGIHVLLLYMLWKAWRSSPLVP
jgi:hypothetical protein